MIYFHSNEGKKNVYTKLDDVLEINKPNDQIANEGYEVLGKTVNNNYQNFTQKLIDLQNKPAMQPYS